MSEKELKYLLSLLPETHAPKTKIFEAWRKGLIPLNLAEAFYKVSKGEKLDVPDDSPLIGDVAEYLFVGLLGGEKTANDQE